MHPRRPAALVEPFRTTIRVPRGTLVVLPSSRSPVGCSEIGWPGTSDRASHRMRRCGRASRWWPLCSSTERPRTCGGDATGSRRSLCRCFTGDMRAVSRLPSTPARPVRTGPPTPSRTSMPTCEAPEHGDVRCSRCCPAGGSRPRLPSPWQCRAEWHPSRHHTQAIAGPLMPTDHPTAACFP